ncbi:FAD-dependent thymidylate synthase [Candidatus Giovannonibacteria bacterium]|nr:FAD-dependent thymidylate synthase [Candidatus Giovannonibacteria bacterium]
MNNSRYQPDFRPDEWSDEDRRLLYPFVTNLDGLVTVLRNMPPEMVGALCSRASRANGYLLRVLLDEYLYPVLRGENKAEAAELEAVIDFYHKHGVTSALNSDRARKFYARNHAGYGDESVAQMTGTHFVLWGVSQVAMKLLEDSRIGAAPQEKSTRMVDFTKKVQGKYLYYTDPDIVQARLGDEYKLVNDRLFARNAEMVDLLKDRFAKKFPDVPKSVIEKKAFDTARGFLPMSTLGQVAFDVNGQAAEYMINKYRKHGLGEMRWITEALERELDCEIPSLLYRLKETDPGRLQKLEDYQMYLATRISRIEPLARELFDKYQLPWRGRPTSTVKLVDNDVYGEVNIIAGILFPASEQSLQNLIVAVRSMTPEERCRILLKYVEGRTERWQKVGRAFENAFVTYEILVNGGAYRDIHRHRLLTQERQYFTTQLGYDVPVEIAELRLAELVHQAMEWMETLWQKVANELDREHAQYCSTLFHRVRFYQKENLREAFWEIELRTKPDGHPDYRKIEQEKYRLLKEAYPGIAKFMLADLNEYDFARRGMEERAAGKIERLEKLLGKK